jgi:putative tricarboxylic transport membrane protein
MIGLFGLSEIMKVLPEVKPYMIPSIPGRVMPPFFQVLKIFRKYYKTAIRSGIIGIWVGALPALGSDAASYASYAVAKRKASKEEYEKFGRGSYEGLIAAEVADNACIGGDILPTLTLGIPGSAPAAAFLGALNVHNIVVGPMINFNHPGLVYLNYAALIIANLLFVVIAFRICGPTIRLLQIPRQILMPLLVPVCVIGAFASTLSMWEVYTVLVFGLIGYVLVKNGVPLGPMCIGFILGPMADLNFRRAMEIFSGQSIWSVLSRPVGDVLICLVIYTYIIGICPKRKEGASVWKRIMQKFSSS